jgi:hypothetical protein
MLTMIADCSSSKNVGSMRELWDVQRKYIQQRNDIWQWKKCYYVVHVDYLVQGQIVSHVGVLCKYHTTSW